MEQYANLVPTKAKVGSPSACDCARRILGTVLNQPKQIKHENELSYCCTEKILVYEALQLIVLSVAIALIVRRYPVHLTSTIPKRTLAFMYGAARTASVELVSTKIDQSSITIRKTRKHNYF